MLRAAFDRWVPVAAMAAATAIVVGYILWTRALQGGSVAPLVTASVAGALLVLDTICGAVAETLGAGGAQSAPEPAPSSTPVEPSARGGVAQAALDRLAA